MQMDHDVIGTCLGFVSVLGRGEHTARSEWFFREVYWSDSMNMLIGMAPKMCHHTVTGAAGGRPDRLLKWHRVLGVTSCDSQLRDGIFAVVALVEFKFSPL